MASFMIDELAAFARVDVVRQPGGMYTCPVIANGTPLSAYAMAAALRLKYQPHAAVRVVCWGWTTYKDVCAREGLTWEHCIHATKAADLVSASLVVVDDSYADIANPRASEMIVALLELRAAARLVTHSDACGAETIYL